MKVTLKVCARCEKVGKCKAHISSGSWDPEKGEDPCEVDLNDDSE
jgi:hypothetical protein